MEHRTRIGIPTAYSLLYTLLFAFSYAIVIYLVPPASMIKLYNGARAGLFNDSLALFSTAPVNYYEVLVGKMPLSYLNYLLPIVAALMIGIYFGRYSASFRDNAPVASLYASSVISTYILSAVYWKFGSILGGSNFPATGTSAMGVALFFFLFTASLYDLSFYFHRKSTKPFIMSAIFMIPSLALWLLYITGPHIHAYALLVFLLVFSLFNRRTIRSWIRMLLR
ncbi:MAG: hypothetical protein QXE12_00105 [Conexivisphaerales archaeon]